MYKLSTLVRNHKISIEKRDKIAINPFGGIFAHLKGQTLFLTKMTGKIIKICEIGHEILKMYWIGKHLILFTEELLIVYDVTKMEISDRLMIRSYGSNVKNNRILVRSAEFNEIYVFEEGKISKSVKCTFTRAQNVFGTINHHFYSHKKMSKSKESCKKLKVKHFQLKNGIKNEIFSPQNTSKETNLSFDKVIQAKQPFYQKNLNSKVQNRYKFSNKKVKKIKENKMNSERSYDFNISEEEKNNDKSDKNERFMNKHLYFTHRSISVKYKNGKLTVYRKGNQVFRFYGNLKFVKMFKKLVIFSNSEFLYIYDQNKLKKYEMKVKQIEVLKKNVAIITKRKIFSITSGTSLKQRDVQDNSKPQNRQKHIFSPDKRSNHSKSNNFIEIAQENNYFFNENILDILSMMVLCRDYEILFNLIDTLDNRKKLIKKYFRKVCKIEPEDDLIEKCFAKSREVGFFELAIVAQSMRREDLAHFLINKEKNKQMKVHFYILYPNKEVLIDFITTENDHLILNLLFSLLRSKFSNEFILELAKNENVCLKYKNFIKKFTALQDNFYNDTEGLSTPCAAISHFKDEFSLFLSKTNHEEHFFHELLRPNLQFHNLKGQSECKFTNETVQRLREFYRLTNLLKSEQSTVDSAVLSSLRNGDRKSAFLFKYSTVMSHEKYKYLKKKR